MSERGDSLDFPIGEFYCISPLYIIIFIVDKKTHNRRMSLHTKTVTFLNGQEEHSFALNKVSDFLHEI